MSSNNMIKKLSIKDLFKDNDNYLIPIYQRNYAWGKSEVEQLVVDINDFTKDNSQKQYFIGTLIVFEREIDGKKIYETIDGQQRLTTLSILLSVLKNEFYEDFDFNHLLKYESREISTDTLKYIYNGDIEKKENLNANMLNAYKVLKKSLDIIKDENKDALKNFKTYLLENVKILRVQVPKDTDLNHYFEIMNNRGEQLEKHEVLKARMIEKLSNTQDKTTFNNIWEACSDMNRYVQYGFNVEWRDKLFGNSWNSFMPKDFATISNNKTDSNNKTEDKSQKNDKNIDDCEYSIDDILNDKCFYDDGVDVQKDDDKLDRFNSPVTFSNFLLHVLKVTKNNSVALDDKRLLEAFEDKLDAEFVKEFGYNLLKMRFLLDNYIIKREYSGDKDEWSLKQSYKYTNEGRKNIQYKNRFKDEKLNKNLLMILSMFHVSNPSQIYKYWLTGALNYLYENFEPEEQINGEEYLEFLEDLAKNFLNNRYLAKEPQEFENIIFEEVDVNNEINCIKLNKGTSVEHFIFNYLDYLLWRDNQSKFDYFSFSFSNSVEHFYPQNPIDCYSKWKQEKLDDFGNLCLMSVSKNAKLNNHPPKSKKEYYPDNKFDSPKQHLMMEKADNWNIESIQSHRDEMLKKLELK